LVICYQPHWEPPYEALVDRLETGEADVRLAYSGFADSSLPQCSLSALNYFDDRVLNFANEAAELWRTAFLRMSAQAVPPNLNNRRPYCLQLDLVKMTYACGIRIYQLGGGQREYQGLLEVLLDHSLYNPSKDLQIPFKCIDHHISRHREERLICSVSDLAYEIKFKSNKISGNELQTEPFPVFPLEQAYSLFIHCSIRLCRQAVLCDPTAAECLSGNQEGLMKPRSPRGPSIERWVHLNIIQSDKASLKHSKARYGNSFSKGVSGGTTENLSFESEYPCDFAVCLTQAQLVVISTVTVIVIITVGLISLIALRQKHLFPHVNAGSTRTEPLTETLQYGDPLGAIGEEGGFHNLKPYEYINCSSRISDCNPPSTYSNLVVSHEPWMQAPVFHQAPLNETLSRSSLVHNQRTDLLVIPASTVSQSKAGGYMKDFIELNPNLYTSAIVPRTVISSATNASIVPQTLLSPGENSYEHNTHGIMISNPCLSTPATRENRGQRQIQRPTKQSLPFRPRHEIKSQTTEVDAPGQAPSNDLSNGNKRLLTTLENPLHRDNEILLEAGTDKADLSSTYLRLHPISGGISKKSRRRQQVLLQVGLDPVVGFMSPMEDSLTKRQQALASTPGTGKPTEVGTSGGQIQVVRYDLSGKEVKNELGQPLPFNQIQNSEALQTHMTAGYQGTTSHIRPAAPQGLFYDCNGMWCSDQDGTVYMKTTTAADTDLAVNLQNSSLYPLMKEVRCSSQQKNTQNNNPNNTFFCKSTANSVFSTDRIEDSSLT
uniref:ZP domain-containing protein n=1 Tax=Schistocephalus solidus TaxID=70667 RepID=A0A183SXX7_SCHSO